MEAQNKVHPVTMEKEEGHGTKHGYRQLLIS